MRIAYITRTTFGAMGTSASYMLPKYVGETCPVVVLSPNDPGSGETVVYEDQAVDVIDIYHRNRRQQMARAADALLEFQPDIIHLFYHKTCHQYPAKLRHLFPNTCWIVDFRSPLLIFESDFYKIRDRLRIKAFFLQFFIDAIAATSIPILRTHLPLRFKPFFQLPFGIDLDEFPNAEPKEIKPKSAQRFVFSGNIAKVRRIETLVQGFGEFVRSAGLNAVLDIYGTGNAVNTINRIIRENALEDNIKMKGAIPQIELFKKLCDYDAGIAYAPRHQLDVAPSLKAMEYAAAGLPVISSDTLGHRSCVRNDGFEFLLFKNSVQGISKALQEFFYQGFSQKAVSSNYNIVSRFNWKMIVDNCLLPAYQRIERKA